MDCPKTKKTKGDEVAVACPPADSLVEILSRLHAKPLFRFKCVSKEWCELIANRLRCRKFPFPQTLEGFLTSGSAENYGSFIDLSEKPVPFIDPSFSFLAKLPEIEKIVLLGSCNGLVLFGHRQVSDKYKYDSLGYIVCNPATEQWVSVPSSGYTPWDDIKDEHNTQYHDYGPETYLIFDPAISPHFQLIQPRRKDHDVLHEVHTFSSVTGAWRLLELEDVPKPMITVGTVVCLFNGILHMLADKLEQPLKNWDMILAVGGEGRPFRTLHWPQKDRGSLVFIGQSQGHIHCMSGYGGDNVLTELSIWVLEDYNAEKWVLRDNVSLSHLFKRKQGWYNFNWEVVAIHPNRGLVFFADYWNRKLISYDIDKKEVRALCSLHGYRWSLIPYVPYFAESAALAEKH